MRPDSEATGPLARDELKRRASAGVFVTASRGVAILLLSFAGSVVVARLLTPQDLGVVAIGMSFVYLISTLADGGLGAALIRRPEEPEAEELQALTGLQVGIATGAALVVAAAASRFGEPGWVVALMVASMPLAMLQLPGRILLERRLHYRPLALVEVSQVFVYHAWAIGFVVAGFGVWGLASATVVMRAAGAVVMGIVCREAVVRPRFSWGRVRPLLGFGVRFQAASVTSFVEGQGLNASIAAIVGVSTLGLWSLAKRVMEVPWLLFESLWRVSFPAMSQLVAAKASVVALMERAVGMAAIGSGIMLTALAASAPGLVPAVFGEQWRDASVLLPPLCLALAIAGPVSVAAVGFLYAVGDASAVLRAHVLRMLALFAVALPLLPLLGTRALIPAVVASSVVDAVALARGTRHWAPARLGRALIVPLAIGIVSATAGWLVAELGGADLGSGLAGGSCAVVLFLAGVTALRARLLRETVGFVRGSVRAAVSRDPAAGVV